MMVRNGEIVEEVEKRFVRRDNVKGMRDSGERRRDKGEIVVERIVEEEGHSSLLDN